MEAAAEERTLLEFLQAECSVVQSQENFVLTESSCPLASGWNRGVELEVSASCLCPAREWPARAVT